MTFGTQPPDSKRERSSRSSTMRCMRRVFASIVVDEALAFRRGQVVVEQRLGEAAR